MRTLSVEELQKDFEQYISKVENGETIKVISEYGEALLIPYTQEVRCYTYAGAPDEWWNNHNDAC